MMIRARSTISIFIAVVAVFAIAATTASASTVTIKSPQNAPDITGDLSALAAQFDVDAVYEIRSSSGSVRSERIRGISIDALFKALNADTAYRGVNVLRPNGGSVFISKSQVAGGAPSPVIYESGGEVRFLRPSYNAQDNNADDLVSSGGNLILQQTADTNLKITAKASKTKAKAREAVKFSATVEGIGAGEQYAVTWVFADGKSDKGEEVSHRFSKRGVYRVLATVKTAGPDGTELSSSAVVQVQIGKLVKSDKKRSGGGNNDATGAPDSGASDGQSGSGDTAATDTPANPKQRRKKQQPQVDQALTPITGQLLDPNAALTPEQQSELAARSGTQADPQKQDSAAGIPGEAIGVAGALGLLGFGFILELGAFGRFRSRFSLGA